MDAQGRLVCMYIHSSLVRAADASCVSNANHGTVESGQWKESSTAGEVSEQIVEVSTRS